MSRLKTTKEERESWTEEAKEAGSNVISRLDLNRERQLRLLSDADLAEELDRQFPICGDCEGSGYGPQGPPYEPPDRCETCWGDGRIPREHGNLVAILSSRAEKAESRLAAAERERDAAVEANHTVAVCALHVDEITNGEGLPKNCLVCGIEAAEKAVAQLSASVEEATEIMGCDVCRDVECGHLMCTKERTWLKNHAPKAQTQKGKEG